MGFRGFKILGSFLMAFFSVLSAWEDHPDAQDFSEQDSLFKAAQKQSKAYWDEQVVLSEEGEAALDGKKDTEPIRRLPFSEDGQD